MKAWWPRTDETPTPDELRARASENRSIVGWIMGFWIVAAAGFALWIWVRYSFQGDLNCPVPGASDSTYGTSSWQWFPPGEVCSYPGTHIPTDSPSAASGVVGIFLVVVPLVVLPLWIWSEVKIRDVNRSASAGTYTLRAREGGSQ